MASFESVAILITFDIFGTVLDWRTGLIKSCESSGFTISESTFESIVDRQAEIEHGEFLTYEEITRRSLVDALGMDDNRAAQIGANAGRWPLFADAPALAELMKVAPCAAISNSDLKHRDQVQESLGFALSDWLSAEEAGMYKPDPMIWLAMAKRRGIEPSRDWWHVSAYADFDLTVANDLGLTTVFVPRPHSRPGPATHTALGLYELLDLLDSGGKEEERK